MNKRLKAYLRSLGLAQNATDDASWEMYSSLRGLQRSIANCLNYTEEDQQARTNCDLSIRGLGFDPENPSELLASNSEIGTVTEPTQRTQYGGDGASLIGDLEAARAEGIVLEQQRTASIREYAELAGTDDEIVRTLVADANVTADTARTRILEDHRQRNSATVSPDMPGAGPAIHSRNSETDFSRDSLTAVLMLRHTDDPLAAWPQYNSIVGSIRQSNMSANDAISRAVDRANELRGLSMLEVVSRAMAVDGIRCEPTIGSVESAFNQRAAMGTATLSGIFTSDFNAQLLQGYETAPDTTDGWTNTVSVNDYKANDRHRLEKGGRLKKRGRGQTAESRTFSEASESYKVREYAEQFVIDRQDLINDTFGALQDFTPQEMGASARELRPDLVYAILLANAAMRDGTALFHADHGNLVTASPLGVTTLEEARALLKIQRENDRNLNLMAKYLIVPGQLESTADTVVESSIVVGAGSLRGEINSNAKAGIIPRADARLDNGVIDPDTEISYAGSGTTWFLSTGSRNTIEIAYIRALGQNPQVRSFVLDRGQFGIGFDVSHSVGAKALDWRGMVKVTG